MSCASCSTCGTTPTSARAPALAPALAPVPAPARGSPAVGDDERDEDHSDNEYVLSEDDPNISELSLLSRVMDARRCWSIPLDDTSQDTWNQLFNDIGMTLAGHSVHAVKPLVAIFDRDGPKAFLDVAIWCVLRNVRDELLCWAFVYCQEDVTRMTQAIVNGDRDLIAHINKQAAFHECFPGNRQVGRARLESHADTDTETETETDTGVPPSLQPTPTPTPTPTQTSQPLETRVQQYIDDRVRDIIDQHRAWLGKTARCPSSASVSPSPSLAKREPHHHKHLNQNLNQNQPRLSTHTLTQSTSEQSQPQQQPLRSQSGGTITASAASCGEACRCDAAAPPSTCSNTDTETCTSTSTSTSASTSTSFSCHPHLYPHPHPHHPHPPDTLFPMTPRSLLRTAKSPTSRKSVSFLPVPDIIPASQLSPLLSPQLSPEAEPQPEPSSVSASASVLTSLDELHRPHSKQTAINLTLSSNHHPKQRELSPHELNHDTSYFSLWSRHLPFPLPGSLASLLSHPTVFSIISVVAAGGVAFVAFRNRRLWNMR